MIAFPKTWAIRKRILTYVGARQGFGKHVSTDQIDSSTMFISLTSSRLISPECKIGPPFLAGFVLVCFGFILFFCFSTQGDLSQVFSSAPGRVTRQRKQRKVHLTPDSWTPFIITQNIREPGTRTPGSRLETEWSLGVDLDVYCA